MAVQEIERQINTIASIMRAYVDNAIKPDFSRETFQDISLIFTTALSDKMFDLQESDKMDIDDRIKMAESLGSEFRRMIKTYTGIETKVTYKNNYDQNEGVSKRRE